MKIRGLDSSEILDLQGIIPLWSVNDLTSLSREFKFNSFRIGLEFVNIIGDISETLNHHPDIMLSWSAVTISITTHSIKSLSELDVELARRIDNSYLKFSELKG